MLGRYVNAKDLDVLHVFTVGAFKGLLGALDALTVERDTLRQALLKDPQSPGQADLSCPSCMQTTLKYSSQCSDLQSHCTSLQLTLAQRTKDLETLSADLETSKFEKENLYLRWENAKKADLVKRHSVFTDESMFPAIVEICYCLEGK